MLGSVTTTIPLPGTPGHAASFEVPLEMLAACHQRIQRQCDTLQRLLPHLQTHGADTQAREAASAVIRYFDRAALDHHADEEQDLFPALLEAMAGSDAVCLRQLVDTLTRQHRELDVHWKALRGALERVATGDAAALTPARVETFVAAYTDHLQREESELLPMAARLIDDRTLQQIGRAMRLRRGIGGTGCIAASPA